jgi:hypothetical protein
MADGMVCVLLKFSLADKAAKMLEKNEVTELLGQPNLLRLAFIDGHDGMPVVHPVWYYYENEKFFVATEREGNMARSLRKNPACYFLVDIAQRFPSPRGIRGKAIARVIDDPDYATEVTRRNLLKYFGTTDTKEAKAILEMGKTSSVIEIMPRYMATWKF